MSRYDDIPEAFRRAMEEAGWRNEAKEGEPPRTPRSAHPMRPWWTSRWLWVALLALVLIASFNWIVTTYTEWLWFNGAGYEQVWLRQWSIQIGSFVLFFVVAALFLIVNWRLARRRALRPDGSGLQFLTLPGVTWLITGIALFLAFIMGQLTGGWQRFLRFLYRVPYGTADPIFEQDLSFYLFDLPVYNFIRGWLLTLTVMALLGVIAIYIINNLPALQGRRLQLRSLPPSLLPHVALLLSFFFLLWAAGHWLSTYDLLHSARGVVYGAAYTDLNATLPALRVQTVLMVLLAVAAALMAWRPDPRPVLILGGLWLLAGVGLGGIYPTLLQRYVVEPNELARERPYIEHNIALTRQGFNLHEVVTQPFQPDVEVTAADLEENDVALQNIRLWDYRPLQQTYSQLQELRPYYEFSEIDIDRYEIDGQTRQVMLAGRELNKAELTNPTWVNQKLEFTHGYGIVMNPVDRFTPQGRPFFYIQDLPPQSSVDIQVDRPELYYGEMTDDHVFVNSGLEEFDYPSGNENVYSRYQGEGGVLMNNLVRRLAFAIRFGEMNLLLSEYITDETRVMFHRRIQERVNQIAPFLWQDHDPYLVVVDGRLVWMMDAYTVSNQFPYSEPSTVGTETVPPGINYIRNAVKITIDAYSGDIIFYIAEPDDPLIQAYERAFPGMFQPLDAMPPALLSHIRYPEDLFQIQIQQYLTYHMQDVQVFYNKEDLWEIPMEVFEGTQQPMEPYYVTFSLPGEEETEYLLIQPYTPAGKNNMIAWIAARNDPPNYGELYVYEMPKQELVFGPIQIEGRIDQDATISQQFSLWNQLGSRVLRGNLIVVPINDSFLYVEPIYLESDTSALPELKRVVLATGDSIVMRETLDEALAALLGEAPAVVIEDDGVAAPGVDLDSTVEELIISANEHLLAADEALRAGDWTAYGREQEALARDLEQLLNLSDQ